jgi:hypothetical protein
MKIRCLSLTVVALLCVCVPILAGEPLPTDQECTEFAKKVEASIAQADPKVLDQALDIKGLVTRATEGVEADEKFRQGFIIGAARSAGLGTTIINAVGAGGNYKFLRARQVDGQQRVLFRMLSEQGVNYHDFTVEKGADGQLRFSDVFIFMMGEPLGQTMRRLFLQASATNGGVLGKLLGWENDFIKNAGKFQQITQAMQAGQAELAKKLYYELPASMQNERIMLVHRTQWAGKLGEKEYVAAFEAIRKAFPNDPSMQFISIDGLFMNKQYDEGIKVLDSLIQTLGPDAHLYMLKGNFYMVKGDLPNAIAWDRKAIELEPDLMGPYWALLTALLQQKDFAAIREVFLTIERRKLVVLDGVDKSDGYAEFVKSPEYEKWQKDRPKQETPAGDGKPDADK